MRGQRVIGSKGFGQLMAPGDAELLIAALEVAFDGTDREVHVSSVCLLVRPAAACIAVSSSDGVRRTRAVIVCWGCDGAFAPGQKSRGFPLRGGHLPSHAGTANQDGSVGARFGGVKVGTEVLELLGDLLERGAVSRCDGEDVGGASPRQVAVDLVYQGGQPGGNLSGPSKSCHCVQGAAGPDQVADLFAKIGCRFRLVTGGRKVAGGCRVHARA